MTSLTLEGRVEETPAVSPISDRVQELCRNGYNAFVFAQTERDYDLTAAAEDFDDAAELLYNAFTLMPEDLRAEKLTVGKECLKVSFRGMLVESLQFLRVYSFMPMEGLDYEFRRGWAAYAARHQEIEGFYASHSAHAQAAEAADSRQPRRMLSIQ